MGNKAKAGCPIRNIQQTLDGLTDAGLTVAVYEEVNDIDLESILKIDILRGSYFSSAPHDLLGFETTLKPVTSNSLDLKI